jgi:septal ring factor EnvC (AmiA/AmiB activator)
MIKVKHIFLILLIFTSLNSFSQTRKELEAQRKELQAEVNKIRSLLSQTRSVEKNELDELAEINLQINAQTKLINAFTAESRALNKEIYGNEKEIKKLSNELKVLKDDYADMIFKSYKSKSKNSRIMFLLSSENFHQAFKRLQYMKQYTDFRKAQGVQVSKKSDELLVLNDTLSVRKKEKEILVAESKKEKQKIDKQKVEQQDVVNKIKKQEKKYISQIKKKQREERQIDKKIKRIIQTAINKSNNNTKNSKGFSLTSEGKIVAAEFEGNKGKLPWPLEKGVVSRRYGKQKHPSLPGITVDSGGVHIRTEKDAKARAIFNGTVLQIQSVSGKKAVYIQHGNYITLYNNLETVTVKKGDKVTTKQSIGKVYTDKISKKTILKFQIWKNTKRLNPADWIYKM